ncbi:hypothetical protein OH77DRAFT_122100 [Trametes cingulata]|nr:hypothetical protein OH77DRAFT_122100 [Trametes cingulata]
MPARAPPPQIPTAMAQPAAWHSPGQHQAGHVMMASATHLATMGNVHARPSTHPWPVHRVYYYWSPAHAYSHTPTVVFSPHTSSPSSSHSDSAHAAPPPTAQGAPPCSWPAHPRS